jgi:hypothetical protein
MIAFTLRLGPSRINTVNHVFWATVLEWLRACRWLYFRPLLYIL